ncbi:MULTISPECIES: cellulose synthase complex periplasmic endoglucanase BcsZ [Edwardsiella]|uniref:cellulase n=2 Tax=Edwardsiella anguillarum TaxID=1821960 RepID=A0A076LMW4_9GAMM|nr:MULTISPECIES: cellulose synthase complex periplasmic endoglucanase BcsZ [Edwardsiella]AKM46536.1 endo-1,4-D-glucanase [Edwardsiella sp. EA181011]GAJ67547.1 endoglucanase [Edwardsiella piscicida]AIJ08062.1 Endoglucanase precursor [Edwardsiella anguillarum ET080813]AKR79133.1 cellulase [Edwardsiella sp. LADL05-105]KAB0591899.1 cellulase [Edwardsiella anguillarum]
MKESVCRALMAATLLCVSVAAVGAPCKWHEWEQFRQGYISPDGRVIDPSSPRQITTSEGQSYALFFALVNNDRALFAKLLAWTQNNLARGSLSQRLPAWKWGLHDDGRWRVLDDNSAADADLWMAYVLLEAGRLWQDTDYQHLGVQLLERIAREEVVSLPGVGVMLLPGRQGFRSGALWTVNPSYLPPQILARLAPLHGPWNRLQYSALRMLEASSPQGIVPDWTNWQRNKGWLPTPGRAYISGYDAIRAYLWAGMLADGAPAKRALVKHWQPMVALSERLGYIPEKVSVLGAQPQGEGNVGFSAAMLPFLDASNSPLLAAQRQRVKDNLPGNNNYYSSVLTLFGLGWDQRRYRFNLQGELVPNWGAVCDVSD